MVDGIIYDKYREHCQKEGIIISRQFEKHMEERLTKNIDKDMIKLIKKEKDYRVSLSKRKEEE